MEDHVAFTHSLFQGFVQFGRITVPHYQSPGANLRHILFLALLGVGVVILAGPVIAVASVVLSVVVTLAALVLVFAVIGFLFWAPIYFFYAGREAAGERIGAMGHSLGRMIRQLAHVGRNAVVLPVRFTGRLLRGGLYTAKVTSQFIGEVALVGLSGAAIGAALGLTLSAMSDQNPAEAIPLNALVGGGIASVVGVALALLPRRSDRPRGVAA
jgi:hypothetical protein